jgi:hypothetical protein
MVFKNEIEIHSTSEEVIKLLVMPSLKILRIKIIDAARSLGE